MDVPFVDRLLVCSDCQQEFIFTAGEQLFFQDKQFRNDPKRCKGCKSRRAGLAAAANGVAAAGLSRTETRTLCSECGIDTTVPFKPTQGRPVLCRQCFQTRMRSAAPRPTAATTAQTASALTQASTTSGGQTISADAALLAAVSMASASAASSIASAADLASITRGRSVPGQSASAPAHTNVGSSEGLEGSSVLLTAK